MTYEPLKKLSASDWCPIATRLATAADKLARFDQTFLESRSISRALTERMHFADACASSWLDGELVHMEDLILHDNIMDARTPTHDLIRASDYLRRRRLMESRDKGWPLTRSGLAVLCGHKSLFGDSPLDRPPDPVNTGGSRDAAFFAEMDAVIARSSGVLADHQEGRPVTARAKKRADLVYDPEWDETSRLDSWLAGIEQTTDLPGLLSAALAYDAWLVLQPLERDIALGRLLAESMLRDRGCTRFHLHPLSVGLRKGLYRWNGGHSLQRRICGFLDAISAGADECGKTVRQVLTHRRLMLRSCESLRSNSKLPKLVDLFVKWPAVTIPGAAKALKVSPQAIEKMFAQLGNSLPRELSGRSRYRAWGIV